jgi:cysteinyl-tRNA synthetase
MALKLFNTQGRKKEVFSLRAGKQVRLYTCGPTVYKSQHIGNYRTYLFEDILKRVLKISGYSVMHVMNITDVGHLVSDADEGEDKMEKEARKRHKSASEIARHFEQEFKNDLKKLNILSPSRYVRATNHIKDQIKLIQVLEKKGFTYVTKDGIYFDTTKDKDYGRLDPNNIKGIKSAKRIAKGEKKHKTDFALWKFSAKTGVKRQMEWKSPWGIGFPGWHIECSAMAMKYLGATLDIHSGGIDHIQIHHTNEIAQSESATGKTFAKLWMHGAFLNIQGEKMAKSSADTNILLETIIEKGFDPLDLRFLTFGTHYRKPLSFSWASLESARNSRLNLISQFRELPDKTSPKDAKFKKTFLAYVTNDLNMSGALASVFYGLKQGLSKRAILWADGVLGLRIDSTSSVPTNIMDLAKKREQYRLEKDWENADKMRKQVESHGFGIKDTKDGPVVHKI